MGGKLDAYASKVIKTNKTCQLFQPEASGSTGSLAESLAGQKKEATINSITEMIRKQQKNISSPQTQ